MWNSERKINGRTIWICPIQVKLLVDTDKSITAVESLEKKTRGITSIAMVPQRSRAEEAL